MSRFLGKGPSPAMVVSVVALSFALAGSAIAGTEAVTSSLGKKDKRQVKRISKRMANKQIKKRGPKLSVAHAARADDAKNAKNAENAENAENAVNGAPRAFARVLAAGGVDEDRTKGLTDADVTVVGTVYCFELGFTARNVQATVDWFGGGGDAIIHATVNPPNNFGPCPAGHDASARIVDASTGTAVTRDFYITFDD